MTKTQKNAVANMVRTGFTFAGDNYFTSYRSAIVCLRGLVAKGYAEVKTDAYGTQYVPTEAARDFVEYGIEMGA